MSDPGEYSPAFARHYDRVYSALRTPSGDADWYARLAAEADGPVLELGAGTGRVLLAMAACGRPCTGLDASQAMLEELSRKPLPGNVKLVRGDMRDFSLETRFSLVAAPFRVFQHLETVEDQLACLGCVRRHLAPGGRLAFDVFVPDLGALAAGERPEQEDARYEQDGETVVRHAALRVEHARQRIHVRMRYERRRGARVLGSETSEFRMRYFFRYELEHLLARAGFDPPTLYGDFAGTPLGADSRDFVVVSSPSA